MWNAGVFNLLCCLFPTDFSYDAPERAMGLALVKFGGRKSDVSSNRPQSCGQSATSDDEFLNHAAPVCYPSLRHSDILTTRFIRMTQLISVIIVSFVYVYIGFISQNISKTEQKMCKCDH
jgi:hypothetical protein